MFMTLIAAAALSLEALPAQQTALVGQPVRFTLAWKADQTTDVFWGNQDESYSLLRFTIDSGSGPRPYREHVLAHVERVEAPVELRPGEERYQEIVLVFGRYGASTSTPETFAFPAPGKYTVRIAYADDRLQAEASPVTVTVAAPTGPEATIFQRLNQRPFEIKYGGGDAEALLSQYPSSAYLRLARIDRFHQREVTLADLHNPDTNEPLWTLSQSDRDAFVREFARRAAEDLRDEPDWGAFEEARLNLAASYAERAGDAQGAALLRQELLQRFPRSLSAFVIRRRTDTTAPVLAVAATPSSLWPPNHTLQPISVTVTATDNADPHPTVTLVSITCNDDCDPAADVADATLGSDDRAFRLRSERKGAGSGRTYTILYQAMDAAGNRATATVSVTVPHDQGNTASVR